MTKIVTEDSSDNLVGEVKAFLAFVSECDLKITGSVVDILTFANFIFGAAPGGGGSTVNVFCRVLSEES